jgi:hypothetical protein
MPGCQALGYLLDPFLNLSLVCQRPAVQNSTVRHPAQKSLFHGEAHGGFGTLLSDTPLATALMEHGSPAQGKTEAKRVCALLSQGHRLIVPRQPLVRIAQGPQRPGGIAAAKHPGILPMEKHRGAVLLGIVERNTLSKMRVCRGWRSQAEQCRP